jgi:hypothetical protein
LAGEIMVSCNLGCATSLAELKDGQDYFHERITKEETMIRLIAIAFALAVATSAQATPLAPLHQPDGMITQVREACGAGRVRINGVCVARTTKRHVRREVRRCARWNAGVCVRYF